MQYIVHTCGEVLKTHNKAYVINAKSEEEAQELAMQKFKDEFEYARVGGIIRSYSRTKRALAACLLMLIAIIISLFPYDYTKDFLFFHKPAKFSFEQNPISYIFAITFYCVYIIRFKGIINATQTFWDITFCILSIFLLASICNLILWGHKKAFKLLITVMISSLFGVKLISALGMAFLALVSVANITTASEAMGIWGIIYVMCAFMGLLLYLSVEPAVLEAMPQIKASFKKQARTVTDDFSKAKNDAQGIINHIHKK